MARTPSAHRPCHWHEDPDGGRFLVPGCMTRVHESDIDTCDCPTVSAQLADAQQQLEEARERHEGLREWCDRIVQVVEAHPDGRKIIQSAARTQ
ncbi:hypothetical protein ABR738_01245 [Streptomyces sp. Edi4]|uniref:hypothetical protein n=1 Tax=Streptomyces sp. Edi4 TaxID=3162527 RepID=UPI0033065538